MKADSRSFGHTRAGTPVEIHTLEGPGGLRARVMTLGATLVELLAPDRHGRTADVVLGFDTVAGYEAAQDAYLGCVVGRCANRIARGELEIDGERFLLACNEGTTHLHGGPVGLSRVVWRAETLPESGGPALRLGHESPDGDQGYPGNLSVAVTYRLTADGELRLDFTATTDRPTVFAPTHHAYFDLSGGAAKDVLGHELWIAASRFTPTDELLIPTGAIAPVAGTPLDFNTPAPIGARIDRVAEAPTRGYDHNLVLDRDRTGLFLAARLHDPSSDRTLELSTTEPGLQLYTANHLDEPAGKGGRRYGRHSGVTLEAQRFPDAVHHPGFPSVILRPGEVYHQTTVYRFSADRSRSPGPGA